jgi:hypothetical protein
MKHFTQFKTQTFSGKFADGNFTVNHLQSIFRIFLADKQLAQHFHFYPEISQGSVSELYQSKKFVGGEFPNQYVG